MRLGVADQLAHALWRGPASLARARGRTLAWAAIYLALAALVLYLVGKLILAHRGDLRGLLVSYLFPESWSFAGNLLVDRFFAAQERQIIVNAAIAGSLLAVQITLFPVKEQVSAAFERDAKLLPEPPGEFPLIFQAWEEVKLFLIFVAVQASVFWIGYSPDAERKLLAQILSYTYLFASFGIDFLSPVLQRHRQRYSTILKTLALHPVLVIGFGALLSLPAILVGRWVEASPAMPASTAMMAAMGTSVVSVVFAALIGTHAGAQLLADARATARPSPGVRALSWLVLLAVLGWNGYRFGAVATSLHHKSQILKCDYSLDWTSIGFDRPSLGGLIGSLSNDAVEVGVHFDVTISNPTRFDVELEDNRVVATHDGEEIARTRLTPVKIPAGGRTSQRMEIPLRLTPSQLARGPELLRAGGWAVTLWLHVAPGFDFPIYLLEAAEP